MQCCGSVAYVFLLLSHLYLVSSKSLSALTVSCLSVNSLVLGQGFQASPTTLGLFPTFYKKIFLAFSFVLFWLEGPGSFIRFLKGSVTLPQQLWMLLKYEGFHGISGWPRRGGSLILLSARASGRQISALSCNITFRKARQSKDSQSSLSEQFSGDVPISRPRAVPRGDKTWWEQRRLLCPWQRSVLFVKVSVRGTTGLFQNEAPGLTSCQDRHKTLGTFSANWRPTNYGQKQWWPRVTSKC